MDCALLSPAAVPRAAFVRRRGLRASLQQCPPPLPLAARHRSGSRMMRISAVTSGGENKKTSDVAEEVEKVTKKWGLEAGLWKALRSGSSPPAQGGEGRESVAGSEGAEEGPSAKGSAEVAKELLAKYGGAYLATSITLTIISFSFFYVLIDRGVDVPTLLQQVGIEVDGTGEKVGTVALAYAAHKAASPIRFPPTVILTPLVADFFAKKKSGDSSE